MFEQLAERLKKVCHSLQGKGRLTEANIDETLATVRRSLLEADVALDAVKIIIDRCKQKALGKEVELAFNPGQKMIQIIFDELVAMFGKTQKITAKSPPTILLF